MILAQKQILLPMSPPTTHRRHPSAPPAVVVQPTKVPGILSISKPLRTSSPRQHYQQQPQGHQRQQHRSPKPKHLGPQNRTPQPQHAEAQPAEDSNKSVQLKQVADVAPANVEKKPPTQPATPLPENTSTHAHARRNNIRQPSPPIHSSQVEGNILPSMQSFAHRNNNSASNSFDPFVVSSDSDSENSRPPLMSLPSKNGSTKAAPALTAQPSGKLARRRNHAPQAPATPTPASRAVPVPRSGAQSAAPRHNLSRSAPGPHAIPRHNNRRSSAVYSAEFPVCDDTTDVEDNSPPSTPTRETSQSTWQQLAFDGPRTAPLSASNGFPFAGPAGTSPSPARRHYRTPSEGVFSMSFDEDISSTSDSSEELKKLFGFPPKRFGSVGHSATRAAKEKAGFFASSVFQNSPSPDELPPPAF
ncbi:hypothetical protein HYDPIDRAFT_137432 [Hydnomerulius pinastri MD-312]|uniref:Uncharacterized protein n=1 Tax=Hydnomerulius pinastri MD-312 TaxID=994086 RepID=A0A0C9WCC1_9AGAM|nr:hypothetical protein HYDPIDRAFT_137432 [Hydnomerulius pinastri MD-312]